MSDGGVERADELRLRLLVIRCQTGDERAFQELYETFAERTRRYVRGWLGARGADDVQQEVWMRVYKRIGQLADPAAFRTWLYMTTRHATIDSLRRSAREAEIVASGPAQFAEEALAPDPQPEAGRAEAVRSALDALPAAQREAVILRYWNDLTYAEIALVTGCPIGTVRSRLHHAKRALGDSLGPLLDGGENLR
jgi:RNA polymerase sigma-70 factor (ECF subfamily)